MIPCNLNKVTGWKRDGFCKRYLEDKGSHTVCVIISDEFLRYTLSKGNNLINKTYSFPGLVQDDRWCVCLERWFEAYLAGYAPKIVPEASDPSSLTELESRIGKRNLQSYYQSSYHSGSCNIC